MKRHTIVFGPAYLDRVLRVDRPLIDSALGPPLDGSCDGALMRGAGLSLVDPSGARIEVEPPPGWPGPWGEIRLSRALAPDSAGWSRAVRGLDWYDDLGGMGAGFASALGGRLVSALGPEDDPTSRAVGDRIARAGIEHCPIRIDDHPADWTLLVTSGEFGDKLPIGFRGGHAAIRALGEIASSACDLRVVASLPNRLAEEALRAPGAGVRFFAPALRNVLDREPPLAQFAGAVDFLSLNRREWEALDDREAVADAVPLLAITDGPLGSLVRFREGRGARVVRIPAFPRAHPPRDTNRAGEAYASTLLATLLDAGWTPGPIDEGLVRRAALRASAASALVLDMPGFGFPGPREIDRALGLGRVGDGPADDRQGGR